jgi:aminoglycoside phosphotransferase (APT) family kinase protein
LFQKLATEAAEALGASPSSLVQLGGSTHPVYLLRDRHLVVKIRVGAGSRVAAETELARARALARRTSFVRPAEQQAVLELSRGAVATVWLQVEPGAPDFRRLGTVIRALHDGGSPSHLPDDLRRARLDDLADIYLTLQRLEPAPAPLRGSLLALRLACDALSLALAALREPPTVVHGDLHPPNILWSSHGPVLCDTDEVGLADPRWDVAFLFDPGRPERLAGPAADAFREGYARPIPDADVLRVFARAAHLRRTVNLLVTPRPKDRWWWNAVRLGSWRRMVTHPEFDLVPAVAQGRGEQVKSAFIALMPSSRGS